MAPQRQCPQAAYLEDCDDTTGTPRPDTKKIATKGNNSDADSGYATTSPPKNSPQTVKAATAMTKLQRRATVSNPKSSSSKPQQKSSHRTKDATTAHSTQRKQSNCDCRDCNPRNYNKGPLDSKWDTNYAPFSSGRSNPTSPTTAQRPPPVILQRPPMNAGSSYRNSGRPMSFAGTSQFYNDYATNYSERGPPLSNSTYPNGPTSPVFSSGGFPNSHYTSSQLPASHYIHPARESPKRSEYVTGQSYNTSPSRNPAVASIRGLVELHPPSKPNHLEDDSTRLYERRRLEDSARMPPPSVRPSIQRNIQSERNIVTTDRRPSIEEEAMERDYHDALVRRNSRSSQRSSPPAQRPSLSGAAGSRPTRSYTQGAGRPVTITEGRRRPVTYYGHEQSPETQKLREAENYQNNVAPTVPLTVDALKRNAHRGSESGSRSRASSSRDSGPRSGSGVTRSKTSSNNDSDNFKISFAPGSNANIMIAGDLSGQTVRVVPTQDGGKQLHIESSSKVYRSDRGSMHSDYSRDGQVREIEDGRRRRETFSERSGGTRKYII